MNNFFDSGSLMGAAFASIFGEPSTPAAPTNSSPLQLPSPGEQAPSCAVLCNDCTATLQKSAATQFSPMDGVVKYRCPGCAAETAATCMAPSARAQAAHEGEQPNEFD